MSVVKTAEAVCIGHPDKLCDLIADQILDEILYEDRNARVAVEVMAAGRRIIVTGEVSANVRVRSGIRASVRTALSNAGYKPWWFLVYVWVRHQSQDISDGVTTSLEARAGDDSAYCLQGAGDQGTVYGYACNETPERLPLPLVLAHKICRRLNEARAQGAIKGIFSDGKAQVSVRYDDAGKPKAVDCVVVSVQHSELKDSDELRREITSLIIGPACDTHLPIGDETTVLVNPSGRFVEGGPKADTGLTGRKLMVDTYGGLAGQGGGAFSGKDASKVDRSGAYMARLIAKTVVDARLASSCQVGISYAIGKADPVAFSVDTLGTGQYTDQLLTAAVRDVFNFRPAAIIDQLGLRAPGFVRYSTYGHFGDRTRRWENTLPYENKLQEAVKAHAAQKPATK